VCSSDLDFSIFEGRRLQGWPVTTIKDGKVVVENGVFAANISTGKCLMR
jgi:dihydropyrimidinase